MRLLTLFPNTAVETNRDIYILLPDCETCFIFDIFSQDGNFSTGHNEAGAYLILVKHTINRPSIYIKLYCTQTKSFQC